MTERSSIFDMIGPVMIGPSSSHTAGVARIGRLTRRLLGEPVSSAQITFYNSFATTYEGHGSDRALLAGLMDLAPDDERIREARALAEQVGLAFTIKAIGSAAKLHPNSVRIHAEGATRQIEVLGVSRGGGLVTIAEVDGFSADVSGQSYTLFVQAADVPGSIAFIASVVTHEQCNIATMNVSRKAKHSDAGLILELDSPLRPTTLDYLAQLHWVQSVNYIEPIS
jgi:L-serine dehydratase